MPAILDGDGVFLVIVLVLAACVCPKRWAVSGARTFEKFLGQEGGFHLDAESGGALVDSGNARFFCVAIVPDTEVHFSWEVNGHEINTRQGRFHVRRSNMPRESFGSNLHLHASDLKVAHVDHSDAGSVACRVQLPRGPSYLLSTQVLVLNVGDDVPDHPLLGHRCSGGRCVGSHMQCVDDYCSCGHLRATRSSELPDECLPYQPLHKPCLLDVQCLTSASGGICTNYTCSCYGDNAQDSDSNCERTVGLGHACGPEVGCVNNTVCRASACTCRENFVEEDGVCKRPWILDQNRKLWLSVGLLALGCIFFSISMLIVVWFFMHNKQATEPSSSAEV